VAVSESPEQLLHEPFVPLARPVAMATAGPEADAHPMLLLNQGRIGAVGDVLLFVVVAVLAEIVLALAKDLAAPPETTADPRLATVWFTLLRGGLLLGFVLYVVRRRGQSFRAVGLSVESWWMTGALGVAGAIAAFVIMVTVAGIMMVAYRPGFELLQKNPELIAKEIPRLHPFFLIGIAMFVGIYEEIIFRGFMLTRLRRAMGSAVAAVIVCSLLFGLPHGMTQAPVAIIPIFLLGALWSILTLWRRSVVPAIVAHVIFDAGQLLSLYVFYPQWR